MGFIEFICRRLFCQGLQLNHTELCPMDSAVPGLPSVYRSAPTVAVSFGCLPRKLDQAVIQSHLPILLRGGCPKITKEGSEGKVLAQERRAQRRRKREGEKVQSMQCSARGSEEGAVHAVRGCSAGRMSGGGAEGSASQIYR